MGSGEPGAVPAEIALEQCQARLAEAEAILDAIHHGRIDALVIDTPDGARIFTVAGAERPYRVFIEQMGEGAASLAVDGTILFCNRQFAALLHLTESEASGRNIGEFLAPEQAAQFRELIASPHAGPIRLELTFRCEACSDLPVHLSASVFEEGGLRTVCVIVSDLTEQRRSEEQLRQAQKMEAIGQLTSGVAHDFNNLLTVIIGNLEFLERDLDTEIARDRVRRATLAATRGAKLTEQLLAFARQQHLAPSAVNVNEVVRTVIALMDRTIGPEIQIVTQLRDEVPQASADPAQVEMMILNLALNARDAMPNGGVIRIETAAVSVPADRQSAGDLVPGGYVRLSVIDHGTGMSPETKVRALDPFFTTKPPGAGSGLGLSQVYGVATQFGGALQIDSALGQGTAVHVYLPCIRADQDTAPRQTAASKPVQPRPASHLVLIVDDDPDVCRLIAELLAGMGYRTLVAAQGKQALTLLQENPDIGLLCCDIAMPGMTGFELAEQARQARPDLPILLMTGYADFARVESEQLQWPVLRKPFTAGELHTMLARLLHGNA